MTTEKRDLREKAAALAEKLLAESPGFRIDPTSPEVRSEETTLAGYVLQLTMRNSATDSEQLAYVICDIFGIEPTQKNLVIGKMLVMEAMRKGAVMSGHASAEQVLEMFSYGGTPGCG